LGTSSGARHSGLGACSAFRYSFVALLQNRLSASSPVSCDLLLHHAVRRASRPHRPVMRSIFTVASLETAWRVRFLGTSACARHSGLGACSAFRYSFVALLQNRLSASSPVSCDLLLHHAVRRAGRPHRPVMRSIFTVASLQTAWRVRFLGTSSGARHSGLGACSAFRYSFVALLQNRLSASSPVSCDLLLHHAVRRAGRPHR